MRHNQPIPVSISLRFSDLDLNSLSAIVFSARKGLKSSVFYDFADYIKMSEKSLAGLLNLSSRTISNYKVQKKTLEPVQSEHLLKLIALFGKGEEIFGNVGEFNYWLNKPFWNAMEKPIDWLVTPGGVDLVSDELDRLAHSYAV
ncbi:MAG: antitoxin Xre-like helix-turn-helix domain-containing protein [Chitinophagaceae bacterium]